MVAMDFCFNLFLMVALFCGSSLAFTRTLPVSVERTVQVSRGGRVDLRQALDFRLDIFPPARAAECRVTNVVKPGSACGAVLRNIFDCRTYSGPILYQHFGCFFTKELATFVISTLPPNTTTFGAATSIVDAYASTFSVGIEVIPPNPILAALKVDAAIPAHGTQSGTLHLTLIFPPSMIGGCHYEVVSDWPVLPLPTGGRLEGVVNQPFPTGYVPRIPLTYRPHRQMRHSYTDYILIKFYLHKLSNDTLLDQYAILPFQTAGITLESGDNATAAIAELNAKLLYVRQAVNAPIKFSDFKSSFDQIRNFTRDFSTLGLQHHPFPLFRFIFPVLSTGSFHSLFTTSTNVSYSVFTTAELRAGHISFHPTHILSSTSPFFYSYNISNLVGITIARGEIAILALKRMWDWPSQRTNLPLAVAEGGIGVINSSVLEFYMLTPCLSRATMRILQRPSHGHLVYENGSSLGSAEIFLWVMQNTSLLHYKHNGSEELADVMSWTVQCPQRPTFQLEVVFSVLVAALDDAPPTIRIPSNLKTNRNWALPLSPSLLQVLDPDTLWESIQLRVGPHHQGTVMRTRENMTDFNNSHTLLPFLSLNNLIHRIAQAHFYEVLVFSPLDLENQKIWYVPPSNSQEDAIEVTLADSRNEGIEIHTLYVTVSPLPPNQTLLLSTSIQHSHPRILRNKPLPLSGAGHMYLTPYFLFSKVLPYHPVYVTYVVHSPPSHGLLCSLSHPNCTTSLSSFTQHDLNHHHILYHPNETTLKPDHFTFELTIQGVPSVNAMVRTFNLTTIHKDIIVTDRLFWIQSGRQKRLAPRFFRNFVSLFGTENITFQIQTPPQYGNLLIKNGNQIVSIKPSSFTYSNLKKRLIWYKHIQHKESPRVCTDHFEFDAIAPNQHLRGRLPIILRHGTTGLSVRIHSHELHSRTRFIFSMQDFSINSSFCLQFVTFFLEEPPLKGHLTLKDHQHQTWRELRANCSFTAADIYSGALSYRLNPSNPLTTNTSDHFSLNVSDPSLQQVPTRTNRSPNTFVVIILPPIGQKEHILEVNISTEHALTWLPNLSFYGYILASSDFELLNSTLSPHQLVVQLESGGSRWGNFVRKGEYVAYFTVEQVRRGEIAYQKNPYYPANGFEDRVEMGMYTDLSGVPQWAFGFSFPIEWAVLEFAETNIMVSEEEGVVQLTISRRGALWFQSSVRLTTVHRSAMIQKNCSISGPLSGDFCKLTQDVVFPVGVVSQEVRIQLLDDQIAEGYETFSVQLLRDNNLLNAILRDRSEVEVTITDTEDYSTVRIVGDAPATIGKGCDLETDVREDAGHVTVPLVRSGNLEQEIAVICYTQDIMAKGGSDYVPRLPDSRLSEVRFGVNRSMAECVVRVHDDQEYEEREGFFVHLATTRNQSFVNIESTSSSLCVYIRYDKNDAPLVKFSAMEVFAHERKTISTLAHFTLSRTGPNIIHLTTQVKYVCDKQVGDTASEGVDFRIFNNCSPDWDNNSGNGGCVTFSPGQVNATLTVEILPDEVLEGDEIFHLVIAYVRDGRYSQQRTLKITILDASEPEYLEFVEPMVTLNETVKKARIEVRRRGYLPGGRQIMCKLKAVTATAVQAVPGADLEDADFLVGLKPQTVNFAANESQAFCTLAIKDDSRYEGVETLTVSLEMMENVSGVILLPNASVATVSIVDPEDVPVVEFAHNQTIRFKEPLYNTSLNSTLTLQLQRSGDLSFPITVYYSTNDQSARSGYDFEHTLGIIRFAEEESSAKISIRVLANHASSADREFGVQLSLDTSRDSKSGVEPNGTSNVPVQLGAMSRVTVCILNYVVTGPYFPTPPLLDNVRQDGVRSYSSGLYFDLPLACITSCDDASDGNLRGCEDQQIMNNLTVYSWEVSVENDTQFRTLDTSSVFTLTQSRELPSAYLQPNLFVRCRAQAVNVTGNKGYSRTSVPVQLTQQHYSCYRDGGVLSGTLSSYKGFEGRNQDVVHVSLTIPALPNSIPLLSMGTSPDPHLPPWLLNHTATITTPSFCSTLDLIHADSLYDHLNRSSCEWHFSTWYPVSTLLQTCQGRKEPGSSGGAGGVITLTTFAHHVQFGEEVEVVDESNFTLSLEMATSPSSLLPPPLHIFSSANHSLPYVFPLSIGHEVEDATAFIFFYSISPAGCPLSPSNNSQLDLELLYMHKDGDITTQVWRAELQGSEVNPYPVVLELVGYRPAKSYSFHLPLGRTQHGSTLLLDLTLLFHETLVTIGERVNISLELSPHQQLQKGLYLEVLHMVLCEQVGQISCSSQLTIMGDGLEAVSSRFDVQTSSKDHQITIDFATDSITLVTFLNSSWNLHLSVGLSRSQFYKNLTIPLVFLPPPTETPTSPPPPSNLNSVYTIIAVVISAVFVVVVCLGVIGFVMCAQQGRAKFQAKTKDAHGNHYESRDKLNSPHYKEPRNCHDPVIKRTNSTIGFPTQEKKRVKRPLAAVVPIERRNKRENRATSSSSASSSGSACKRIQRSRSLPSLFLHIPGILPPPIPHRHNPTRPCKVTIITKKDNTDSSVLDSWAQQQLKASKAIQNLHIVRDLAISHKSYGVNEIQQHHQRAREESGPYARYVVGSLAVTAKTPEPGARPSTQL